MKSARLILILSAALLFVKCASHPPTSQAPRSWVESMTELSETLAQVLPLSAKKDAFEDQKNREQISRLTGKMATLAQEINRTAARPDADPSLKFFTQLFEEDMTRAQQALQMGQLEYARHALRNSTSYCISCHSRSNDGPEFSSLVVNKQIAGLGLVERAEFFAATRQFTRAAREFDQVLKDETMAHTKPFDWEQAARFALALDIRVRQNAKDAMSVVEAIMKSKQTPAFMKEDAKAWKKSLQDWLKEKSTTLTTSKQRLDEAKRLISRAKALQKFPLDRAGDVEYLRASAHLHDILRSQLDGDPKIYEEAIYYSGMATEAVRDLSFWSLHEAYYEICIRYGAHTDIAKKCFDRLESSVLAGYSGSSGTSVPGDVQKRLSELKQLAQPQ